MGHFQEFNVGHFRESEMGQFEKSRWVSSPGPRRGHFREEFPITSNNVKRTDQGTVVEISVKL